MKKKKNVDEKVSEQGAADDREDSPACQDDQPAGEDSYARVTPAARKVGEGSDNLRQRSDWFQRRTGRRAS